MKNFDYRGQNSSFFYAYASAIEVVFVCWAYNLVYVLLIGLSSLVAIIIDIKAGFQNFRVGCSVTRLGKILPFGYFFQNQFLPKLSN
jgi:hypothetical protein